MARRYNIILNIVSELQKIKQGTTVKDFEGNDYAYLTTPGFVGDDFEIFKQVRNFPAIFVNGDTQSFEGQPSRRYRSSWDILLTVYVKSDHHIEQRMSDVIDDIIVALSQDITRGGYVNATYIVSADVQTRLFKPYGLAELTFTVVYYFGV